MSNSTGNVNTKCPYYISETEQSITCEGIQEKMKNVIRFQNKSEKKTYQEEYCAKYPNGCRLSKVLNEKNGE